MKQMTRKFIEQAADQAGWNCDIKKRKNGWYIMFNTDTPRGQDACFEYEVKHLEDIKHEVYDTWNNYDPSEETTIWLGPDGHGKNGAPDDIEDILNDMKFVENMLEDLAHTIFGHGLQNEDEIHLVREAIDLRDKCLSSLTQYSHRARKSKHIDSAKGFKLQGVELYDEIVFWDKRWILIGADGLHYGTDVLSLENLCEIVENIINNK